MHYRYISLVFLERGFSINSDVCPPCVSSFLLPSFMYSARFVLGADFISKLSSSAVEVDVDIDAFIDNDDDDDDDDDDEVARLPKDFSIFIVVSMAFEAVIRTEETAPATSNGICIFTRLIPAWLMFTNFGFCAQARKSNQEKRKSAKRIWYFICAIVFTNDYRQTIDSPYYLPKTSVGLVAYINFITK